MVFAQCYASIFLLGICKYEQSYLLAGKMNYECVSSDESNATDVDDACVDALGEQCTSWNYSSPYFQSTMVSSFDLVCARAYLVPFYKSLYLVGYFIGLPVAGMVADRFGRRIVIVATVPLHLLAFGVTAMAPHFWVAAAMRALTGFAACGFWKAIFVLS